MSQLKLSEIWIYPVKSLGGIRVKNGNVLGKGLQYDRRYMLVDEDNRFITQRLVHEMALFKLSPSPGGFKVCFKNNSIELPLFPKEKARSKKVVIWDDTVLASEMDEEYNEWFSGHLGIKCSLVFFPEPNNRAVDKNFASQDEQVSLADGYPFLIIGQRSLDDLNSRLKVPVPMNRFRPNFVFEGGSPYEEDTWKVFTIGSNQFKGAKPCARCSLPTVNQDTGQSGKEPLATLSTYRKNGSKVNFGQNLVAVDYHQVNEGDIISIKSFQSIT